jgi:hypothetical protein
MVVDTVVGDAAGMIRCRGAITHDVTEAIAFAAHINSAGNLHELMMKMHMID